MCAGAASVLFILGGEGQRQVRGLEWSACPGLPETVLVLKVKASCPRNPLSPPKRSFQQVFVEWLKDVTTSQSCWRIKEIVSIKML